MAARPQASQVLNAGTILCLDNDNFGLHLTKAVLETMGYSVLTASTTQDALKVFSSSTVDAVVLDVDLTRSEGDEVAHEMKRLKPEVPTLLLSDTDFVPAALRDCIGVVSVKLDGPLALGAKLRSVVEKAHRLLGQSEQRMQRSRQLHSESQQLIEGARQLLQQSRKVRARDRLLRKKFEGPNF